MFKIPCLSSLFVIATQDYITTLERLPKSRLLELFHRRYLLSLTVSIILIILTFESNLLSCSFWIMPLKYHITFFKDVFGLVD